MSTTPGRPPFPPSESVPGSHQPPGTTGHPPFSEQAGRASAAGTGAGADTGTGAGAGAEAGAGADTGTGAAPAPPPATARPGTGSPGHPDGSGSLLSAVMSPVSAVARMLPEGVDIPVAAGLAGLAVVGVLEWPVAVAAGAGYGLARLWNRHENQQHQRQHQQPDPPTAGSPPTAPPRH